MSMALTMLTLDCIVTHWQNYYLTSLQIIQSLSSRRFCHHGRQRSGSKTVFLSRNFNVKQDALRKTDGNILFVFPDWYFGALIFSVVNAVAKTRLLLIVHNSSLLSDEELLLLLDGNSSENPQFNYKSTKDLT